jgi:hypothetical protein
MARIFMLVALSLQRYGTSDPTPSTAFFLTLILGPSTGVNDSQIMHHTHFLYVMILNRCIDILGMCDRGAPYLCTAILFVYPTDSNPRL